MMGFFSGIAVSFAIAFNAMAMEPLKVPQKFLDRNLTRPAPPARLFAHHQIESLDYLAQKKKEWKACRQDQALMPFLSGANDAIGFFLGNQTYSKSLGEMDKLGLRQADLPFQPWSGDYWAIASGILGSRPFNQDFLELPDWLTRFDFVTKNPATAIVIANEPEQLKSLSPSEKYDLIVGDNSGYLTASMWAKGKHYQDANGQVESWMGICHGWAPASITEPRPIKSVAILSYEKGLPINLNPSEIKGIASYSWATNPFKTHFLGDRCDTKDPKLDENGRIIDEKCFNINPATWHIAIVNQLGLRKKSLIIDAAFDYEIWNHPVFSYSYTYFDPSNDQSIEEIDKALVEKSKFTSDKFAKYRSPDTQWVIGVNMKVGYVIETFPSESPTDNEDQDFVRWVNYIYDLELNPMGEIIGGEWHQNGHPDFVWAPASGAVPMATSDRFLKMGDWDVKMKLPQTWSNHALKSSPQGTMLNSISKTLLLQTSK